MPTWEVTHKSAYLDDLVELSKTQQLAVVSAVEELEQDPVAPRGNTIKRMKGRSHAWHYRLGDFRLIYAAEHERRMLRLLAVGPRSNVCKQAVR